MIQGKYIRLTVVSITVVILDQISKWIIQRTIALYDVVPVMPGCFNLIHIQNPGSAFGLFANQEGIFRNFFLLIAAIIAICLVLYLYKNTPRQYPALSIGFALILGGAVGNMIDRLRLGRVTDFIDLYIGNFHWPAFNIADSAISIGMVIFGYHIVFRKIQ